MLFTLLVPDPGAPGAAARDRLADGILMALAVAYGSLMVLLGDATGPGAPLPWPADAALGLACVAALPLRRRHPLGTAVALLPFGAISIMATGAFAAAVFAAAIRVRPAPLLLVAAAGTATSGVYFLLHAAPAHDVWVDFLVRGVIIAAALGWGLFMGAYRRLTASLRERAAQLQTEQEMREERARLTERARIAREMHDVLAHRMSLISLHAGALEVRGQVSPGELEVAAGAIRSSAHEALEELRAVVGVPSGRPEPPQPGLADMPGLLASAREAGMRVDYRTSVPVDGPPVVLGRAAYRIVQEGLTNARKHGSRPAASVVLAGEAGRALRITIINPVSGTPGAPSPVNPTSGTPGAPSTGSTGRGLVGIGERVALAGGDLRYGADGDEFRLETDLPWPA